MAALNGNPAVVIPRSASREEQNAFNSIRERLGLTDAVVNALSITASSINTEITDLDSRVSVLEKGVAGIGAIFTTGYIVHKSNGQFTTRDITVGSDKLSISNGDGDIGDTALDVVEANLTLNNIGGVLEETKGGTNQSSYTLGDTLYSSASNVLSKLSGNTTTTRQFLRQVGTGSASAAPAWDTVTKTDVGLSNVTNDAQVKLSGFTAKGDLIVGTGSSTDTTLGVGTNGQILTADSTQTSGVKWANPATSGTVTSVGLSDGSSTPIYTITGSPVTSSGTLTFTLSTQAANLVFAGPTTGSAAQPTFRSLVAADIPALSYVTSVDVSGGTTGLTTSGGPVTSSGTITIAGALNETHGGTNQTSYTLGDTLYSSASNTLSKLSGNTTSTRKFLRQTGTGTVSAAPAWDTLVAGDIPSLSATYALTGAITGSGLTQSTARLLGRTTASTGAIEEISVGTGLSLSAGSLTNSGVTSATGTSNQVTVSASTGAVTFSLPQSIATSSTPQFGGLGLGSAYNSVTAKAIYSSQSQGRQLRFDGSGTGTVAIVVDADDNTATYTGSTRTVTINASRADAGSSVKLRFAGQGGVEFAADANTVRAFFSATTGRLSVQVGSVAYAESAGNSALLGGVTYENFTQTGNSAGTETDCFSHTIVANTLATNGDSLEFEAAGTFAATSSTNKRVKVVLGSTTLFDSGTLSITTAQSWYLKGTIVMTGATSQKCTVQMITSSSALVASTTYTGSSETLTGGLTLKLTLNGTNANDVLGQFYKEKWFPAW